MYSYRGEQNPGFYLDDDCTSTSQIELPRPKDDPSD